MSGWVVAEVGWYVGERWAWWIRGWRGGGMEESKNVKTK